jgi:hypothetical protein
MPRWICGENARAEGRFRAATRSSIVAGRVATHNPPMPATPDRDADEPAALASELRRVIAADPLALSPRIRKLRTIRAIGGRGRGR